MNKSGFTTVELILTMLLVITIMATITSVTYTYRDRVDYEEIVFDMQKFKNTVSKVVYDDILNKSNKVIKLEHDVTNDKKFYLVHEDNSKTTLTILSEDDKVGINFDGIDYLISDTSFEGYEIYPSEINAETSIFGLDIYFQNRFMEDQVKIHFVIS